MNGQTPNTGHDALVLVLVTWAFCFFFVPVTLPFGNPKGFTGCKEHRGTYGIQAPLGQALVWDNGTFICNDGYVGHTTNFDA